MRVFHARQHNKITAEYGMISFSEDYKSPLLWSHYAEQHAAVCLEFEVPDDMLLKVGYRKDRFKLDGQTNLTAMRYLIRQVAPLALVMNKGWVHLRAYPLWLRGSQNCEPLYL
ncbi:hypothetical protein [Polynucleobacter brandtiae]|uniref:hypothetical protein n=1 Tax=Polynucleobacter brandtiae TaxID=1938816 RepID=UPI000C24E957|nr:hypothetical protein [Polynucleobacter brandtiae]